MRLVLEYACLASTFVTALIFVPELNDSFELAKQTSARVVLVSGLAVSGAMLLSNRRVAQLRGWPWLEPEHVIVLPLVAWLLAWMTASAHVVAFWGTYQRWAGLLTQLTFGIAFLVAAAAFRNRAQVRRLCAVVALAASIVAAYAVLQILGLDFFQWTQGVVWGWQPASGRDRAFSTLGNPDFLGAYLTLTLAMTGGLALDQKSARTRALCWTSCALQFIALIVSGSRSAAVGVACASILLVCGVAVERRFVVRRWLLSASAIVGGGAAVLLLLSTMLPAGGPLARLATLTDTSTGSIAVRLALWRATLPLILERPLTGFGLDSFGTVIVDHYPPELWRLERPEFPVDRAHNALLETLVTQGVLGLLGVLAVGLVGVIATYRLTSARSELLSLGIGAALVGHIIEQEFNVEVSAASLLAWTLAGALIGFARHDSPPAGVSVTQHSLQQWASVALGVVLAVVASVALLQPLRADAVYAQALAAERSNQRTIAQAALTTAVSIWPHEPTYWNALARSHLAVARASQGASAAQAYEQAVAAANRALDLNPSSAQLWANLGQIAGEAAARSNNADLRRRALEAVDEGTRRAPGYWLTWRAAGVTAFNLADYAAAERNLTQATTLFDGDAATWSALGDAARIAGDNTTARAAYDRALGLAPGDAHARAALASLP